MADEIVDFCKACNKKIGSMGSVMNLSYSNNGFEVCENCYKKLKKVIHNPEINSESEFDEYVNNLNNVLESLNVPINCFEYLKNVLINNKSNILATYPSKVDVVNKQNSPGGNQQVQNDDLLYYIKSMESSLKSIKKYMNYFYLLSVISIVIFIIFIIIKIVAFIMS